MPPSARESQLHESREDGARHEVSYFVKLIGHGNTTSPCPFSFQESELQPFWLSLTVAMNRLAGVSIVGTHVDSPNLRLRV